MISDERLNELAAIESNIALSAESAAELRDLARELQNRRAAKHTLFGISQALRELPDPLRVVILDNLIRGWFTGIVETDVLAQRLGEMLEASGVLVVVVKPDSILLRSAVAAGAHEPVARKILETIEPAIVAAMNTVNGTDILS